MRLLKAPPPDRTFWIYHWLLWGAFALVNFIHRQLFRVETFEIGLVSLLLLLLVNTLLCLVFRELMHRWRWIQAGGAWVWFGIVITSVVLGLISSVMMLQALGYYAVLMGYIGRFVFSMTNVYGNWTIMAILFFLWAALYVLIQYVLQLRQTELQLKEARLNVLSGQLNPHFLFNGLNNIRALMLENVDKSRHMLTALAEILRYALSSSHHSMQPLSQEIDIVRSYIDLASIQYEQRLQYEEQIDPQLQHCQIPPMLIQLLVENAVRHGIDRSAEGGVLALRVVQQDDDLCIEVSNPGRLAQPDSDSTGIGLRNIRQRLKLMFSDKADFSMTEQAGQVTAWVRLPLVEADT